MISPQKDKVRVENRAVELRTYHATTDIELRSSTSPLAGKDLSTAINAWSNLPSSSKPQLSWTERLRGLFAPRQNHRSVTTVVPFKKPLGTAGTRPTEVGKVPGDDRGYQNFYRRALKTKMGAMKGIRDVTDASSVHHHWPGSVAMPTRSTMAEEAASYSIPGVPQDRKSSPSAASRSGSISSRTPIPFPRQDNSSKSSCPTPASLPSSKQDTVMKMRGAASHGEESAVNVSSPLRKNMFLTPSLPSTCQTPGATSNGDEALRNKTPIPTRLSSASPSTTEVLLASRNPHYSALKEKGAAQRTGDKTSLMHGGIISKPVLVKTRTQVFQETGVQATRHDRDNSKTSMSQADLSSSQTQLPHTLIPNVTIGIKKATRVSREEERVALKIDVSFIFSNLEAAKAHSTRCRWVEVLGGIISRCQEVQQQRLEKKQSLPYTSKEIKEMEMNAYIAKEKLYLLKQMITGANFVQPQPGSEQRRFFRLICNLPAETKSPKITPSPKTTCANRRASNHSQKGISNHDQAPLAIISRNSSSENLKGRAAGQQGQVEDSPLGSEQGSCSSQFSLETLKCSIQEMTPRAQESASNSSSESSVAEFHSSQSGNQESLPTSAMDEESTRVSPQAQRSMSSPRMAKSSTSPMNSLIQSPNIGMVSPAKRTQPKMAPSCLKKLLPSHLQGPYPTIDSGDLEYVMDKSGSKVVLGRGEFGEVVLMRRHDDGTLLAVKRLFTERFRITVDKAMLREVAAMQAVSSSPFFPKLVGVIDYSSFAQEFLGDGADNSTVDFWRARFVEGLLTVREWMHVCRDVTQGLMALHDAGWVHNDLHFKNTMLCKNPPGSEVAWMGKIIDMGFAYPLKDLHPAYNLTPEETQAFYEDCLMITPEINTQFAPETDIYLLGKLFIYVVYTCSALFELKHLGLMMSCSPGDRPELRKVVKRLDGLCAKLAGSKLPPLPSPFPLKLESSIVK